MHRDRKCGKCGGLDEFLFESAGRPLYYCDTCNKNTVDSGSEMVGPDERLKEEAGE